MLYIKLIQGIAAIITVLLLLVRHRCSLPRFPILMKYQKRPVTLLHYPRAIYSSKISRLPRYIISAAVNYTYSARPKYKRDPDNEDTDQFPIDYDYE